MAFFDSKYNPFRRVRNPITLSFFQKIADTFHVINGRHVRLGTTWPLSASTHLGLIDYFSLGTLPLLLLCIDGLVTGLLYLGNVSLRAYDQVFDRLARSNNAVAAAIVRYRLAIGIALYLLCCLILGLVLGIVVGAPPVLFLLAVHFGREIIAAAVLAFLTPIVLIAHGVTELVRLVKEHLLTNAPHQADSVVVQATVSDRFGTQRRMTITLAEALARVKQEQYLSEVEVTDVVPEGENLRVRFHARHYDFVGVFRRDSRELVAMAELMPAVQQMRG